MPVLGTIPGLLENAASSKGVVTFLGEKRNDVPVGELWAQSERAAAYFRDAAGSRTRVALLLETSPDCLITLFGAWRAGVTVLSLPSRMRGVQPDEYLGQIAEICQMAGADTAVLPKEFVASASAGSLRLTSYEQCASYSYRADLAESGEFVQFSSGSTGRPKGIRLASDAVAANMVSILDCLSPDTNSMVGCSWLPLNHDMGLMGMCLTVLAGMGAPWHSKQLALMPPSAFVANPLQWLSACSEFKATLTCAPDFALNLVARQAKRGRFRHLQLDALKTMIVGSEPVRAHTLRNFSEVMAPAGFDDLALCPGYGLAEAVVAVSITKPTTPWKSLPFSDVHSYNPSVETPRSASSDGIEVVSCGPPLRDIAVRTPNDTSRVGVIEVQGPNLLDGYLDGSNSPVHDGWLATQDLGVVIDGDVYIVGRADDVITVAGRQLHPEPLEEIAGRHGDLRAGRCVAIPDDDGRYVIVAESRRGPSTSEMRGACRWVRQELTVRHGVGPSAVIIVAPGSLPRTTSGKLQRKHLRKLLIREELPIHTEIRFGVA